MATLYSAKIGLHRNKPRIYLHSSRLNDEGWSIGDSYSVKAGKGENLKLVVNNDGDRIVSRKKKPKKDEYQPLIDLHEDDFKKFGDIGTRIRIFVHAGVMIFSKHFQDERAAERVKSLLDNMSKVNCTSFFHGCGVTSRALHEGLSKAGIDSRIGFVLEREREYLESSLINNSILFDKDTVVINAELKDLKMFDTKFPVSNIFEAGIPCTSHSKANVKTAGAPEANEDGVNFFDTLTGIKLMNPAIVLLENVSEYASSASNDIIQSCLTGWNYVVKQKILKGPDFGSFEKRNRWFCLAVSKGLEEFINFDDLVYTGPERPENFESIKDAHVPEESWKAYEYLRIKEERDIKDGKGFRMHIIDEASTSCNVIPRSYAKVQSTGVLVSHPDKDSDLLRLVSPTEHARAKSIPPELVDGLSTTAKHMGLGQSICFGKVLAIGELIGKGIINAASKKPVLAA